jgi:hypothetical protein
MSKQTPIEWLLTHMTAEGYIDEKELLNRDTALNELCRTAFEVEKNELKQTAEFWHGKDLSNPIFESYYDDTFNKKRTFEMRLNWKTKRYEDMFGTTFCDPQRAEKIKFQEQSGLLPDNKIDNLEMPFKL